MYSKLDEPNLNIKYCQVNLTGQVCNYFASTEPALRGRGAEARAQNIFKLLNRPFKLDEIHSTVKLP